jgi:hypothetical protein
MKRTLRPGVCKCVKNGCNIGERGGQEIQRPIACSFNSVFAVFSEAH